MPTRGRSLPKPASCEAEGIIMSIRDMRTGDTIIGKDGHTYTVESKGHDRVRARRHDPANASLKTFHDDELFCVDFDDGLWQQTEERDQ